MDASLMEKTNNYRSEENLASHSSKPLLAWRPVELCDNGDKEDSGKCHHFSIRGFVSEVRKNNREICWPFRVIDNQYKVDDHADFLPPMIVTEFRWWGCKSCLRKAHIIDAGIYNGATINGQDSENRRLEIDGTSFNGKPAVEAHVHAPSLLSDFQMAQGQAIVGRNSVGEDVLINVKDGHLQPLFCCHEKDKKSINAGIHNHGVHFNMSEAIPSLLSETPVNGDMYCMGLQKEETDASEIREIAATLETHKTGDVIADYGTANVSRSAANTSQRILESEKTAAFQGENARNAMSTEVEGKKSGFGVSETELNPRILSLVTDSACVFGAKDVRGFRKRDILEKRGTIQEVDSSVQRANNCDIGGLEIEVVKHREPKCVVDSVSSKDDSPHYPSPSDGNLHRRKARKVRMLNDIIKSEVQGLSRQSHLSPGNDAIQCMAEDYMDSAASRDGKSVADINLNLVPGESERDSFVTKKRKVLPESEDEGPSLIQWLRKVPKKVKIQKFDEEDNAASNAVISSQAVAYGSSGKCLHSNLTEFGTVCDISGQRFEDEFPTNTTHIGSVHSHVKLQQAMNGSNYTVIEDHNAKCINVRKALPKLVIKNHTLCPGREQLNGPCKGIVMHKKQDMTHEVAYGVSSPVNELKNFYGTSEYEKGAQQILKKRSVRGEKGPTEEVTDDAPVICEVAAVGSIQTREKQATTARKKMSASPVSEKKTDPPVSETQAVVDGIPIEILELLQSNYHKNHQLNSGRPTERMIGNHQLDSGCSTNRMIENCQLNSGHSAVRIIEPTDTNKNVRDCSPFKLTNITDSNPGAVPYTQHKSKSGVSSRYVNTGSSACAVGEHTGNSNQELRAQTFHFSGKQRKQVKVKEGQRPATFPESPDVRLCLAPPMSGTQPPNTEPTRSCSPQSYNWNRVMLQHEESNYNALAIPRQHPCRCFPHGAVQANNSHNIHPGIYNSSLLPQTTVLERNPSKATQDNGGMKLVDTSLTHVRRVKQKNVVKGKRTVSAGNAYDEAGKECSSKVAQPLVLYRNDSIPAMHLLRLLDPAVGSAASPLCPTVSNGQADFLGKFKHCRSDYQKGFVEIDTGIKTKYPFNCVGLSQHQIYNQTSSSNLMSPVPRYGAQESLSQKRILSGSNNFNALYEFKGTNPSEDAFSRKSGRKEKRKSSSLVIQQRPSEQGPLSGDRHSQGQLWSILNSPGYSKLSEARENVIQVEYKHNEDAVSPASGSCQTELCVVNRNPADFSIPDENNVYMSSYKDLKPRYVSPKRRKQQVVHPGTPRRQRILKLAASKWNLRC